MKEHSTSYKVRVADAGADGKLKLPSLLQMLFDESKSPLAFG